MATSIMKNRRIDPGICANEILAELDPWAQLLFERLPMIADRDGLLEDRPKRIRALIFPYKNDSEIKVDKLLGDLEGAGFIMRYTADDIKVICIINFGKHQPIHDNEKASILPRPEAWPVPKGGKLPETVDPSHGIKCEKIRDEVENSLGLSCSFSKAGKILGAAGGSSEYYAFAYSVIAIRRAKKWIKSDQFIGAVLKELRQRGRWTDKDNEDAKVEAETMLNFLEKHFRGVDSRAEKKR